MTTKVFGVQQKSTGRWLHVIRFRSNGDLLTVEDWRDGWVAFEADAEAQTAGLEPAEDWAAVQVSEFRFEALKAYSGGEMAYHDVMRDSCAKHFTTLYFWLDSLGLPQPPWPAEISEPIINSVAESVFGLIFKRFDLRRAATLRRNGEIYETEITEAEVPVVAFANADPLIVSKYLIDQRICVALVTDEHGDCETVKAELRKCWYEAFFDGIRLGLDSIK